MTDAATPVARPDAAARRGRSLKFGTILVVLIGSGLGLTAATQDWYTVHLSAAAAHQAAVTVAGSAAAPALTALSLAGLALAVALAIAGRLARIIVGVLGLVVAACILLSSIGSAADNTGVYSAVSSATAIAGRDAVKALISGITTSPWPAAAIAAGVIVGLGSLAAVIGGGLWPGASRRYEAVRFDDAGAPVPASTRRKPAERPGDAAVDDWDELTRGDDPTVDEHRDIDEHSGADESEARDAADARGPEPGTAPDAR